jgi:hypothetical protein
MCEWEIPEIHRVCITYSVYTYTQFFRLSKKSKPHVNLCTCTLFVENFQPEKEVIAKKKNSLKGLYLHYSDVLRTPNR